MSGTFSDQAGRWEIPTGYFSMEIQPSLFQTGDFNYETLTESVFEAYFEARKNKRNTLNALKFEHNFEHNLLQLAEELYHGTYQLSPSICFINFKPVKREIFAADFRDRIVHHLIFRAISPIFETVFIHDSYSCRKGKGTQYGINRIDHFMRSCSHNYTRPAFVLKLDISGYFMSMNKNLLTKLIRKTLLFYEHRLPMPFDFLMPLIQQIIHNNPIENCIMRGTWSDWQNLPPTKSLFHSPPGCGLPIGNLTSQLFSNIYLHELDVFIKQTLGFKYYGRYVDDFVLVHHDRQILKSAIPVVNRFLHNHLKLKLHPNKVYLQPVVHGVAFLGVYIKPFRRYAAKRLRTQFFQSILKHNHVARHHKPSRMEIFNFVQCINSYFGLMSKLKSYRYRSQVIRHMLSAWWFNHAEFKRRMTRVTGG